MLHMLYILAFTFIAFIAISNLIRSLITLSVDSQRLYPSANQSSTKGKSFGVNANPQTSGSVLHPELLDDNGKPINEPLLVMRSVTVEDAREQLDALYNASPSNRTEKED